MTDLISRQDAIDVIMGEPTDAHYPSWYADKIKSLPSAERKTGQWDEYQTCSVCGKQADDFIEGYVDGIEYEPNYCPNCGSRMKGADNE